MFFALVFAPKQTVSTLLGHQSDRTNRRVQESFQRGQSGEKFRPTVKRLLRLYRFGDGVGSRTSRRSITRGLPRPSQRGPRFFRQLRKSGDRGGHTLSECERRSSEISIFFEEADYSFKQASL